jgi:hypothetical protein
MMEHKVRNWNSSCQLRKRKQTIRVNRLSSQAILIKSKKVWGSAKMMQKSMMCLKVLSQRINKATIWNHLKSLYPNLICSLLEYKPLMLISKLKIRSVQTEKFLCKTIFNNKDYQFKSNKIPFLILDLKTKLL